jgi:hypothetical protein
VVRSFISSFEGSFFFLPFSCASFSVNSSPKK